MSESGPTTLRARNRRLPTCSAIVAWVLLLLVFTASSASAAKKVVATDDAAARDIAALQTLAAQRRLAQHPEWLALLHYHSSPLVRTASSQVSDSRFFLAANGRHDAAAELDASIATLIGAADSQPDNDSPDCRFVARRSWLSRQLDLPLSSTPETCTDYWHWRNTLPSHSATLAFPAAYLNSPSSMFGHTLLRLDPESVDEDSSWLSWSLNFAANTGSDTENSVGYAIKGITGAYPGVFQVIPYFKKLQEYGAIENRDIWEYRLNLTPVEMRRMIDHAWELQGINFDYYFFRQNCSFRLLELLEVARPGIRLSGRFRWTAIPINTIRAVIDAELVDSVDYRASKGSLIEARLAELTPALRDAVVALESDPALIDDPSLAELSAAQRAALLVTAQELMIYRTRKSGIDEAAAARRFYMLNRVASLPEVAPPDVPRPSLPELGHESRRWAIGVGRRDDENRLQLGYRFSFHDMLDNQSGFIAGAGIELGEINIALEADGSLQLDRLGLVRLRALSPNFAALRSIAWQVDVDFSRHPLLQNNRLGFRAEARGGTVLRLGDDWSLSLLAGPSIRLYDHDDSEPGFAALNLHAGVGLLGYHALGNTELRWDIDSLQDQSLFHRASLTHQIPLGRRAGLRIQIGSEGTEAEQNLFAGIRYLGYLGLAR